MKNFSYIVGGRRNWYNHFEEQFTSILENYKLAYFIAQLFHFQVFTQEKFSHMHTRRHIHEYSLYLRSESKLGNNPSVHQYRNYSAIKKKDETLSFATTEMDLEGIMLSGINQTEKDKNLMTSLICGI